MIRSVWLALLAVLVLAACEGKGSGGAGSHGFAQLPEGEWSSLAGELADADDLDEAVDATRAILARGGVATRDGERVLVPAHPPAASFTVTPEETVHMAQEAWKRGVRARLEVAEFAHMLGLFGWKLPNAASHRKARQPHSEIEDEYTRERRREARGRTHDAREAARDAERSRFQAVVDAERAGFEARVEAARTRMQRAHASRKSSGDVGYEAAQAEVESARAELDAVRKAVGIAREELAAREGAWRRRQSQARDLPGLVQSRVGPEYGAGEDFQRALEAWVQAAVARPGEAGSFVPLFIAEMARMQDPPIDLADAQRRPLGRPGSELPVKGMGPRSGQTRLSVLEMQLIVAAFDRADGGGDALLRTSFKELIGEEWEGVATAMTIAGRMIRLASLEPGKAVDVKVDTIRVHRPVDEGKQVEFTAVPVQGDGTRIGWQLVAGAPTHCQWSLRNNDFELEGTGQTGAAEDDFVVDIVSEKAHQGTEARSYIVAMAKDEDPDKPSLEDWQEVADRSFNRGFQRSPAELAADMGGEGSGNRGFQRSPAELAEMVGEGGGHRSFQRSAQELAEMAGWLDQLSSPRAYASVEVEYHCANPTTIHRYVTNPVADGGGDLGEACTFTFDTREAFEQWRDANMR